MILFHLFSTHGLVGIFSSLVPHPSTWHPEKMSQATRDKILEIIFYFVFQQKEREIQITECGLTIVRLKNQPSSIIL